RRGVYQAGFHRSLLCGWWWYGHRSWYHHVGHACIGSCPGHPRLHPKARKKDVDAREERGHDAGEAIRSIFQNEKGRPCGWPFHCRTAVRLTDRDAWGHAAWTSVEARIQLTAAGERGDRQ